MNSVKERLLYYIKGCTTTIANFERTIDVSSGYIKNISKSIQPDILEKIADKYPNLSLEWLLIGKGEMLKNEILLPVINYEQKGSPYYDIDFIGGFDLVLNNQITNPEYYINFEPYNKPGVMWCNITGHSMEPAINHGDMIAIKEVEDWGSYLTFGEIYAIVTTNDMRTVKKIRKGTENNHYRLVPVNTTDYDEQDIEKNKISKVFEVLACMKRF